jgi:phosphopantothenoylcysteine decarboxylase / phosphopantothenate---cysteine ligase
MGFALAQVAAEAGAHVTLVSGPTLLETPATVSRIGVRSAAQMAGAVMVAELGHGAIAQRLSAR